MMSFSKNIEVDDLEPKPLVKTPFCEIWISSEEDTAHLIMGDLSLRLDWSHLAGILSTINLAMHRKGMNKRHCKQQIPPSRVLN